MKTADNESFGFFGNFTDKVLLLPCWLRLFIIWKSWGQIDKCFLQRSKIIKALLLLRKPANQAEVVANKVGLRGLEGGLTKLEIRKLDVGGKWTFGGGVSNSPPPVSPLRDADRSGWDQVRQGWSTESRAPFWEFWSNALFKWKVYFFRGSVFGTLYFWSWKRFIFGALYFCIKQAS